ncbi:hypothetical protein ACF0H5_001865 [Mactra antiquata]
MGEKGKTIASLKYKFNHIINYMYYKKMTENFKSAYVNFMFAMYTSGILYCTLLCVMGWWPLANKYVVVVVVVVVEFQSLFLILYKFSFFCTIVVLLVMSATPY